ncbi:MAG: hypothetical protein GY865_03895 [candidate division Zixibacteria bacterium]|nr:hypothetical protein [candidate division Zixibacteria bacterium]
MDILSIGSDNAVFSMAHILDIFNETILISPIILLFLVSIGKIKKTDVKRNGLIFLGLITCGFLIFFVFINPQLGMPRDWDLFSPAPVIITLLLVLLIKRNYLNSYKQIILPILIILLLSPLPYLLTNLNHATSAKYAEYFCSLDLKKSSATLFLLHKYYEEKGNTEKYQEIKDILVDNLATQEKLDSALLAINNGNLNFATEILKRIEPDQYDANYQRVLWKLNFAQGDYEKAMKYIENAIQLNKYNSNLYGDRAKSYMARRDYNKALENLRHGYSLDNSNIYIIDGLVSTYFYLNQYDSTIFYAQKRLVLDPSEAYIHYMLAKSFANKNDLNMAQKYYNKFAEFNIDHPGYKSKLNELSELIKILNAGK